MDRISKFLKKLTRTERAKVEQALSMLLGGKVDSLDIQKLKGIEDIYRVRIGEVRIIFRKTGDVILILEISRRNQHTYRSY